MADGIGFNAILYFGGIALFLGCGLALLIVLLVILVQIIKKHVFKTTTWVLWGGILMLLLLLVLFCLAIFSNLLIMLWYLLISIWLLLLRAFKMCLISKRLWIALITPAVLAIGAGLTALAGIGS